jgi:succinate-acetate transporter protein
MDSDPTLGGDRDSVRRLRQLEQERAGGEIADPAPLGLAALAMTTLVLGMVETGLLPRAGRPVLLGLAIAYGGFVQLLAGMWEFRRGSTFGALTFTSLGGFWASYALLDRVLIPRMAPGDAANAMALFLIAWGLFTAFLWIPSLRTTMAMSATLGLLAVALLLLGVGQADSVTALVKAGGWFGIAAAATGWYAAVASTLNTTFGRSVLPLVPLGRRSLQPAERT